VSAANVVLLAVFALILSAFVDRAALGTMLPGAFGRLLPALLLNAAAAAVALLERTLTRSGAFAGGLLGTLIYLGAGWEGWTMLAATFACAIVSSQIGLDRKAARGVEQPDRGRRSARHAVANCGVAAGCAVLAVASPHQQPAWIALVSALAAAGADTVASEVGKARAGRTVLVTTWRDVAPGTDGGVSAAGSAANVAAAAALTGLGAAVGLIGAADVPAVTVAALLGSFADSLVGATLEQRGIVDNETTNFLNTAVAAVAAVYLSS
jgi:uncharacterized protein (TIGR00297 family)